MKLFRTFSVYTFVGFLNAGIGFLLLPVLTSYLNPHDYGIISLVNVYVQVLMPVVGLSTAGLATVEYHNTRMSKPEFARLFSSLRIVPLLGILPVLLIFLVGSRSLPGLMELPLLAYWMVIPLTLLSLYSSNFSSFLITSKRVKLYTTTTIGKVLGEISITILLLAWVGLHWDGRIYSAIATAGILSLLSIFYYKKWNLLSTNFSKDYIRAGIVFGLPLIMHQIGKFVINQSDRLFLAKMVSIEEMGIYSVAYQVGTVILILVTAFSNFFSPFLYERLNKDTEAAKKEVVKVSYIFLVVILGALLALTAVTPLIFRYFINEKYHSGTQYVFWVGLGYFFWAFYAIFSGYIFYLKKTRVLGLVAIINVSLNLLFNYVFIGRYGAIGAAYATALSYLIVAIIMGVVVARLFPMPWFSIFNKKNSDRTSS